MDPHLFEIETESSSSLYRNDTRSLAETQLIQGHRTPFVAAMK